MTGCVHPWPMKVTSLILPHRSYVMSSTHISHKQGRGCLDTPRPEEIPVPVAPDSIPLNSPKPFPEFSVGTANSIIRLGSMSSTAPHTSPDPDVDKFGLETANQFSYESNFIIGHAAWMAVWTRLWLCFQIWGKSCDW